MKPSAAGWRVAAVTGVVVVVGVAFFCWRHPARPAGTRPPSEHVTLPPPIKAYFRAKEREAGEIVRRQNQELDPAVEKYFTTILAGDLGAAQTQFRALSRQGQNQAATGPLQGPVWQALIDVQLAADALAGSDPDSVLAMARAMTNSLTPGCIYFGGTDPGRGLPPLVCAAPGDPFFVVSQNPLADSRYEEYLRGEYGSSIRLPTTNEVQQCFDDYTADAGKRLAANQLTPGEDVRMVDGKATVSGQVGVMKINALIAKFIFDHNADREFFVEESFPLDWMYPYLSPSGLLMRLNHQPLAEMPAEDLRRDADFWTAEMARKTGFKLTPATSLGEVCDYAKSVFAGQGRSRFKGDARFMDSAYQYKAWSKWRSSIAGIYAWRVMQAPPEYRATKDPQRQELTDAADLAFRQAFALCPSSPEAVYRYVNFLLQSGRVDDAILLAKTCLACPPLGDMQTSSIQDLVRQLGSFKKPH